MSKTASSNEHVSVAARSDVGMKRPMNQDAYDVELTEPATWNERGHRFLVADGMGAHAAGELASQLAVEEIRREYNLQDGDRKEAISRALKLANAHIHERGQADPKLFNMGTTCSSLLLLPRGALVGHVGDSRVYRCRGDEIQQLTFDHSLVWEMQAAGQLNPDDSNSTIPRNVITRCLGPHPDVDVDIEGHFSVREHDTFLLCSDGLTGRLSDHEIGVISRHLDPAEAVDFLVDLANLRGGNDNITVIVARVNSSQVSAAGEVQDNPKVTKPGTHPAWWMLIGLGLVAILLGTQTTQVAFIVSGGIIFFLGAVGAAFQWSQQDKVRSSPPLPESPYSASRASVNPEFISGICTTLEAVATAFPNAEVDAQLRSIRELGQSPNAVLSPEASEQLCRQLANIANQLRDKL